MLSFKRVKKNIKFVKKKFFFQKFCFGITLKLLNYVKEIFTKVSVI